MFRMRQPAIDARSWAISVRHLQQAGVISGGRRRTDGAIATVRRGDWKGGCVAELFLIRHGETEWSRSGQHTGVSDIGLTDRGARQARRIGRALRRRRFAAVLCSPRRRALDTARLAGFANPEIDPALAEWDYGGYEGLTSSEVDAKVGRQWSLWTDGVVPGATPGESLLAVAARAAAVLDFVRPTISSGDDAVLIAHGHILRVLTATWLGLSPESGALFALSAGSLSTLGFEHGRPALTRWNEVPEPSQGA